MKDCENAVSREIRLGHVTVSCIGSCVLFWRRNRDVAVFTVVLIIVAILGHIAIAALSPKDANKPLDERERKIFHWAGHVSGNVFGLGVVSSLGLYLLFHSGDLLFYGVFSSLIIGQLAEYGTRIFLYRTSV